MEIKINKEAINIPQNWNDCTQNELHGIFNILYDENTKIHESRLRITKLLLNKKLSFFKKWEKDAKIESETQFFDELNDVIMACTDWIFGRIDDGNLFINGGLTRPPFEILKNKTRIYHAPSQFLNNITVWEFAHLEAFFEALRDKKNTKFALNRLIAVLYRNHKPKTAENKVMNYEGDVRIEFNKHESTINKRAYDIQNIEFYKKMLILHFYESCRKLILEALHPRMKIGGATNSESKLNTWVQLILELSGGKFGDLEKTGNTNLFTIIEYLNHEQRKISQKS
jgi:hypothetical protein